MPDVNGKFRGSGWSRAREDGWERAFVTASSDGGYTRGLLSVPCPPHVLGVELRGNVYWTVCMKCGEETEGRSTTDQLMSTLQYIFRDM